MILKENQVSVLKEHAPTPLSPFALRAPSLLGERTALEAKSFMEPISALLEATCRGQPGTEESRALAREETRV